MNEPERPIYSESLRNDIKTVVEYLWIDEERHYEENDRPNGHIFETLCRLKDTL